MDRRTEMSNKRRVHTVLLVVACLISPRAVSMFEQAVNGTLLGTLTDSTGASVAGAKVTATEVGTGIARATQTNLSGNYVFPDLSPGTYSVLAEAQGFKKETRSDLHLDVNSTLRADLTMQPGAVTEMIEVTGATTILKTARADGAQKSQRAQWERYPG